MIRGIVVALAMGAVALGGAAVANAEPYESCKAAAQDGVYDIPSDSSDYGPWLDRDKDGIGCES